MVACCEVQGNGVVVAKPGKVETPAIAAPAASPGPDTIHVRVRFNPPAGIGQGMRGAKYGPGNVVLLSHNCAGLAWPQEWTERDVTLEQLTELDGNPHLIVEYEGKVRPAFVAPKPEVDPRDARIVALEHQLAQLQASFDARVQSEVRAVTNKLTQQHRNEIASLKAANARQPLGPNGNTFPSRAEMREAQHRDE